MLPDDDKKMLKSLELEAKKSRLRMWTSYIPTPSNFIAIHGKLAYATDQLVRKPTF